MSLLKEFDTLSDADPRDLSQQNRRVLRAMFEDKQIGLFFFAQYIFGYKDLTLDLHLPICQFLGRWGESELADGSVINHPVGEYDEVVDSWRRLMVCIPREMFKTSLCTRANALWTLARDPSHDPTIGIFNENEKKCESWVGAIAEVVEASRLFQTLWAEMIPPGISFEDRDKGIARPRNWKWGSTGIKFVRDSIGVPELSITGFGIGGASAGLHFTHKILDDIIGRSASVSQAVMQDAVNWLDNSRPLERPAEGGCELMAYTHWAYMDCYAHALKKWPGEYKVLKRSILEDKDGNPDAINGTSIFGAKISTKKAMKLLKTDPFVNWSQYMCIPRAGRDQSFDESTFRWGNVQFRSEEPIFKIDPAYYDAELLDMECGDETAPSLVPVSWMEKAIILDPAPSKPNEIRQEPKANNGAVAVGICPWGRRFALDTYVGRPGPTELLYILMDMAVKWGIRRIAIEEVTFSAIYAPLWSTIINYEYDWEPEFGICYPKGRNKDDRIKSNLIRVFENGYWYFNRATCARLAQELAEFPHGETKDLPDALSYTDEVISRPETPTELERNWYDNRRTEETGRGVTGYGAFQSGAQAEGANW